MTLAKTPVNLPLPFWYSMIGKDPFYFRLSEVGEKQSFFTGSCCWHLKQCSTKFSKSSDMISIFIEHVECVKTQNTNVLDKTSPASAEKRKKNLTSLI